jgi:hypothetical protein
MVICGELKKKTQVLWIGWEIKQVDKYNYYLGVIPEVVVGSQTYYHKSTTWMTYFLCKGF